MHPIGTSRAAWHYVVQQVQAPGRRADIDMTMLNELQNLSVVEKASVALVAIASCVALLLPSFDIRWVAGCLCYLLVAYAVSTVAYLKGRPWFASAGFGSVVLLGLILASARLFLADVPSGPPSYGWGILIVWIILWGVTPLLAIGFIGSVLRPKAGSPWITRRGSGESLRLYDQGSATAHMTEPD